MDSFSVLKDGISFDRKRFGSDIRLFTESSPVKKQKIEAPATSDIRKEFKIYVVGSSVPQPIPSWQALFEKFEFHESTKKSIAGLYDNMTPIQMQGIPAVLEKRDVIGIAPTGSGKTLAYVLPLVALLKQRKNLRGLVITPTKELSRQVFKECLLVAEDTGLVVEILRKKGKGISNLLGESDLLVCTPLMLLHMLDEASLESIEYIVLDEADQLFSLGYLDQVDAILKKCSGKSMKLMFSATMLPAIEMLAYSMLIDPIKIVVGTQNSTVNTVSQKLRFCTNEAGKIIEIRQLIQAGEIKPPVLVFVQSKSRAIQLYKEWKTLMGHIGVMHSGLDDRERDLVVKNFRTGSTWVLICTDLMSRGMDFHGVNLVINYDFPQSIISYIHRIGRAGRAGEEAEAITFYTIEDGPYLRMIANVMKKSGMEVPEWMMNLKNPNKEMKKNIEKRPIKRENITAKYRISRSLRKFLKHKKNGKNEAESL